MRRPSIQGTGRARLPGTRRIFAGLVTAAGLVAVAAAAHWLARYGFTQTSSSGVSFDRLAGPSAAHPFGTDDQSFDIASRIAWGARTTVAALGLGVTTGFLFGFPLGRLCRRLDGSAGDLLRAGGDALAEVPSPVAALALAPALAGWPDHGVLASGAVLALIYLSPFLRLGRSGRPVQAIVGDLAAIGFLYAADAVGAAASIGLLGWGPATRKAADWGGDLGRGIDDASAGIWWAALFPGGAILVTVLGFALLAHGLNPRLGPALRRGNRAGGPKVR